VLALCEYLLDRLTLLEDCIFLNTDGLDFIQYTGQVFCTYHRPEIVKLLKGIAVQFHYYLLKIGIETPQAGAVFRRKDVFGLEKGNRIA
jgi:hypothetical protein